MTSLAPAAMTPPAPRIALVDFARGLALVAMAVFHFAWDLTDLGFIATDVSTEPGWRAFSHSIAASFLGLAGFSLALAHGAAFRPRLFWRRFAVVAGAALLVTAGTYLAFGENLVLFGILHCIAAGSVLAIPFLRLHWSVALVAAAIVIALPALAADAGFQRWAQGSPAFGIIQHLGLTAAQPSAVDFVPLFPFAGYLLAGLGLGLLSARARLAARLAGVPVPPLAAPLLWAGRRSLPIYLLHQPVILAPLMLLAWLAPGLTTGLEQRAEAIFRQDCVRECSQQRSPETCLAACSCVLDELRRDRTIHRQALGLEAATPALDPRIEEAGGMCFRRADGR